MSELYLLSYARETGIAGYWTNLIWIRIPQVKLQFSKDTSFVGSYNILEAQQQFATVPVSLYSTGKERGQMIDLLVKHVFSPKLSASLQLVHFLPGDYYNSALAPDPGTFFRWNVDVKF